MRKAGIPLILPMFSSLLAMRRFIVVFVLHSRACCQMNLLCCLGVPRRTAEPPSACLAKIASRFTEEY